MCYAFVETIFEKHTGDATFGRKNRYKDSDGYWYY